MNTEKELKHFCENIKNLRSVHGLSQKRMAELLHISVKTLRRIESGEVPPGLTSEILYWFHAYFHIPIRRLFEPIMGDTDPLIDIM